MLLKEETLTTSSNVKIWIQATVYDDWYEMMLNVERWWMWRGGEQNKETANGNNETMKVRKWQNGIARDDECEMEMEVKW
jgi:hypothetical protein